MNVQTVEIYTSPSVAAENVLEKVSFFNKQKCGNRVIIDGFIVSTIETHTMFIVCVYTY